VRPEFYDKEGIRENEGFIGLDLLLWIVYEEGSFMVHGILNIYLKGYKEMYSPEQSKLQCLFACLKARVQSQLILEVIRIHEAACLRIKTNRHCTRGCVQMETPTI